ncbi:unnamed protein product [Rhizoctonia solani]|uniref:RGS domain-containing protein n=1 Tax=Rhizoctonia solani TaxID=456999 RepID=A0A8H2WZF9_9AGAM|nr:unnamed protein product [Rhizoctonia solani]
MVQPPIVLSPSSDPLEDIKLDENTIPPTKSPSIHPHMDTNTIPIPLKDNTIPPRPHSFIFSASTILEIPGRFARPPSVKSVGSQWTLVPEMAVSLGDILAMRHLSPLSLKDFEQYLLFEEYGAENLYFLLWLNDYTTRFHAGDSPRRLYHSVARAKATFFLSDSQYELNLAAVRISEFYTLIDSASLGKSSAPHPDAFAPIRGDVEVMLRTSARRFVRSRTQNASTQRVLCIVFGGLLCMAIALAPLMVSRFPDRNRFIRFGMIPPLWLGFTVFLCSVNGICLILYLLGGSRQLRPFELIRPTISGPAPVPHESPYQASLMTLDTTHDVKAPPMSSSILSFVQYPRTACTSQGTAVTVDLDTSPNIYVLPRIRPATPILESRFEFETAGFIPSQEDDDATISDRAGVSVESTVGTSASIQVASARSSTTKLIFDFDALPVKTLNPTTGPPVLQATGGKGIKRLFINVFGPVTRVRSPVISRAQWEVVVRSMVVSTIVALIVSGILVAAPF